VCCSDALQDRHPSFPAGAHLGRAAIRWAPISRTKPLRTARNHAIVRLMVWDASLGNWTSCAVFDTLTPLMIATRASSPSYTRCPRRGEAPGHAVITSRKGKVLTRRAGCALGMETGRQLGKNIWSVSATIQKQKHSWSFPFLWRCSPSGRV
jgi:hypothetical protein